ncbi:MAG: DNA polymerase beta superfamily protein [bacterium]
MNIVNFVKENLCEPKGHKLLYLCKFGSHLYGTSTPDSDVDYKGIFLPSKKSMLLGERCNSLHYKSGDDRSKNSKDDIDIDLWSLQYFFHLVGKGETNAIDLIYSPSNKDCVVYNTIPEIFKEPLNFFDPKNCDAFVGYAIGQMKKYACSGSRLGVIKDVYYYLEDNINYFTENDKLISCVDKILDSFYDDSYCFSKMINGEEALVLCGKVHLFSISIQEFYNRVKREFDKYGERVRAAERNEGVDWKSCSHAARCLFQMQQLLNEGEVTYPLKSASQLLKIKKGEIDFKEVEQMMKFNLELVETLQQTTKVKGKKNNKLINNIILDLYGE